MTARRHRRKALISGRGSQSASKQRLRLWVRLLRTGRAVEAELRERLRLPSIQRCRNSMSWRRSIASPKA